MRRNHFETISRRIPKYCRSASRAVIAGAKEIVQRSRSDGGDKEPEAIMKFFVGHPLVESIIAQGPTKSSVRLRSGIQCDLRVVSAAEYPFALNYFTGSKEHNIEMRNRALKRGWTLNEYRLAPAAGRTRRTQERIDHKHPEDSRRSGTLSRARSRFYSAGIAGELRRIRSGGKAFAATPDRSRKFTRHISLSYHGQRRAQHARRNGASCAGAWALEYLGIAEHSRSSDSSARSRRSKTRAPKWPRSGN